MAIEGKFLFQVAGTSRNTLTYPMLARGVETGATYLMVERFIGLRPRITAICVVPGRGVAIGDEYPSTVGRFVPLNIAESIIMTQVKQ